MFRSLATSPRTTRAKEGMKRMPKITMMGYFPWPMMVMSTRASRMLGKAVMASHTRIRMTSATPPKYPVRQPMRVPTMPPMSTTHKAMKNVLPAPSMIRESRSRPKLSVPRGWARQGPRNLSAPDISVVL